MRSSGPGWLTTLELTEWFERSTFPILRSLYSTARVLTNDPAEAEELVESAYAGAYASILASRGIPALGVKPWMLRILIRTYDPRRLGLLEGSPEVVEGQRSRRPNAGPGPDQGASIGTRMHALEAPSRADVEAVFRSLPVGPRLALWLVDGEGLAYRDVARIVGVSDETVGSGVRLARSVLRRTLISGENEKDLLAPSPS